MKNSIKDLENKNLEIIAESNKINENYDEFNKRRDQEVQKLGKELKENEEYCHNYEKNRIKTQETINELNRLNNELNREKQEILKEFDEKNTLINEYEKELNTLNNEHKQKIQEIVKELNDKDISIEGLNTLNNKHEQRIEELKKELNNKDISLNGYKKNCCIR